MKKKYLLFFILVYFKAIVAFSQCPITSFTAPDTVCSGIPFSISNNTTPSSSSFNWDFAIDSLFTDVSYSDMGNPDNQIITSFSFGVINDGSNWYGFLNNNNGSNNQIIRYDFGTDLNNSPSTVNFGNLPGMLGGYCPPSFVKFNNRWYGFLISAGLNKLFMWDFGSSILNTPVVSDLGNIGGFSTPYSVSAQIDNGELIVVVCNYVGSLSVLNFGNSVNNVPLIKKITDKISNYKTSHISIVKDCNNWYGLVVDNLSSGKIFIVDFGTSLFYSTSTVNEVGSSGLRGTRGDLFREGNHWYALVHTMTTNSICVFDFNKSLNNSSTQMRFLNNPGLYGSIESICFAKSDSRIFSFCIPYSVNALQKIVFSNPSSANINYSNLKNPGLITYQTPGNYAIHLEAIDSVENTSYLTKYIRVLGKPVSNFTISGGCTRMQFFDSSYVPQGGTIDRWEWDFGDGTKSTQQNPVHVYAGIGNYTVSLKSYNAVCGGFISKNIQVHEIPHAKFSFSSGVCAGIQVSFNDLSSIGSDLITSWKWDFGNGDSSNNQNPIYSFPNGGSFKVLLTVTSNQGCSDTISAIATANIKPVSAFSLQRTCVGDTVQFTNTSSITSGSIASTFWNFGDGKTSTNSSPAHPYASGGNYPVKLLSIANNGCKDSIITNIKIAQKPNVSFSVTPSNVCTNNQTLFHDLSTSPDAIIKWFWDFGASIPGDTSISQNPVYSYSLPGNKLVKLIVTVGPDCQASGTKTMTVVSDPHAAFSVNSVCKGSSIVFTNNSSSPAGTVDSSRWDFGDGGISIQKNPVYLYKDTGTYLVKLTIKTSLGCTNSITNLVSVYSKPIAAFSNTIICEGSAVSFTDQSSIGKGNIVNWKWNFGDPSSGSSNTSTLASPSHTYSLAGPHTIKLIITGNAGCKDSVSKTLTAFVSPAIDFGFSSGCEGDYVSFTDLSPGFPPNISTWNWSFGDGGTSSIQNPAHKYPVAFTYFATLNIISSNGCTASLTKPVVVNPYPKVDFSSSIFCSGASGQFSDSSKIQTGIISKWLWKIDTLAKSNFKNPIYTFNDTGSYSISLRVISAAGCADSIRKNIQVYSLPIADFSFNPKFGKAPLSVQFTNLSKGASTYLWNFDGINTSAFISPKFTFQDTGKYTIKLKAQSLQGCISNASKELFVRIPTLDLAVLKIFPSLNKTQMKINAILGNLGNREITNAELKVNLNGDSPVMENMNTKISPGKSITYQFNASFEILGDKLPDFFCVEAINPNGENDDESTNNSLCYALKNEFTVFDPYPNPVRGNITFDFIIPSADPVKIEIFDAIGKLMYSENIASILKGVNTFTLDVSSFESGIYMSKIAYGDKHDIKQILKISK